MLGRVFMSLLYSFLQTSTPETAIASAATRTSLDSSPSCLSSETISSTSGFSSAAICALSCSDEPELGEAGIGVVAVEVAAVEREGNELATAVERGIGF